MTRQTGKPQTNSEIIFKTVFDHSDTGIILTDPEGNIIGCNNALTVITGFPSEQLEKFNTADITHRSDFAEEKRVMKELIKTRKPDPVKMQKRFISSTNETVWVNLSILLITNDKGTPQYFIELAENITEQKLVKELFSVIAHDLRGHFHALLGLSELLADDNDDLSIDEIRKIGKELYAAFRSEYSLLENLLAWSKIQKDNVELVPDVVNLHKAVDSSIDLLNWLAVKKGIEIVNLINENVNIVFDANLLQSVLQNIISNAIKFSHEESSIRIQFKSGEINSVEISDEGTGLTEEEIKKLLNQDIYFSKPGTAREQGSGLGLVICREFIEKHEGRLYIRSKKGKGTTVGFTVKIPEPVSS